MSPREHYFDHAATTPLDPRVLEAMLPYLTDAWGNAHSIHEGGLRAMQAVDRAREQVAELLRADDPAEIVFTSGATEANNWILRSFPNGWVSPFEHSAVREPALALGCQILENRDTDLLGPPEYAAFLSVMAVNNETGTRWNPARFAQPGRTIHSDITQLLGKAVVDLEGIDYASCSAHKLYGPKGVGALYARGADWPEPLLRGGEQEFGARAGTLNVPAIVGFGVAARIASEEWQDDAEKAVRLRAAVLEALEGLADVQVNGGEHVVPHILSLSFAGVQGETLVIEADAAGFAISSGAACSSRSTEPSHVLTALGLPPELLRGTVRVSFGRFNTPGAAAELGRALSQAVERMRAGLGRAGGAS